MYYIYKMCHTPTGRVYIGQHKLPKGKTPETDGYMGSGKVWRSIYKAHPEECVKTVLEVVETREEVNELEKKYITNYRGVYGKLCVNIADGGEGGSGKHSETYKRKMSESMKGVNNPNFGKFGKDNKRYGKKHTPEAIEKMRAAKIGNKHFLGHHPSEETREKIRQSLINFNKTHEVSKETREKMSKSQTGRKHSEETKRKMSEAAKNRKKKS